MAAATARISEAVATEQRKAQTDKIRAMQAMRAEYLQTVELINQDMATFLDDARKLAEKAYTESVTSIVGVAL
jgi:hypothetical protein